MKKAKLPGLVYAQALLPTRGGTPLQTAPPLDRDNAAQYYADPDVVDRARQRLASLGFRVWQDRMDLPDYAGASAADRGEVPVLSFAGSPELFRETLQTDLETVEIRQRSFGRRRRFCTHLVFSDGNTSYLEARGALFGVLDGIALAAPARLLQAAPNPPAPGYFHLQLPDDLARHLRAEVAHADGFTGDGIRVAMVDTGHFWHPFFAARGYRRTAVVLAAGAANPDRDEHGHGTGESANLYAVAPQVTLIPVKAPLAGADEEGIKDRLIGATAAFNLAAGLNPPPHIITCSWCFPLANRNDMIRYEAESLASVIDNALKRSVVVFAAGNGDPGFPAQHPEVIAAGGAHVTQNNELQASDYASAFRSKIYTGRRVPDVCGLVGPAPFGRYLMLPVPPGSEIDDKCSQSGDETNPADGWAVFSGTSAAAPQVAGVIALMLQANPNLKPADVKRILQATARDVEQGVAASVRGRPPQAATGPDLATGAGLVDAAAAVRRALNEH